MPFQSFYLSVFVKLNSFLPLVHEKQSGVFRGSARLLAGDEERGQAGGAGRGQTPAKALACCTSELKQDRLDWSRGRVRRQGDQPGDSCGGAGRTRTKAVAEEEEGGKLGRASASYGGTANGVKDAS